MAKADEFYQRVLDKNTFYYFNPDFEERYESHHLNSLRGLLYNLYLQVKREPLQKTHIDAVLQEANGLRAILAINGFSNEQLKRVTTMARVLSDPSLDKLLNRKEWHIEDVSDPHDVSEWAADKIEDEVRNNRGFRTGIVNLFFEGFNDPCLKRYLPPFELKKLSPYSFSFEINSFLDTLVKYKEKGSYSGKKENNPEEEIKNILKDAGIPFVSGKKLERLKGINDSSNRTMDFIIPDQKEPLIIIESSFLSTTSSGQGDKAKAVDNVKSRIRTHYRGALFVGFVDGVGWYVRKNDLETMVSAFDDVFTYHYDERVRFRGLLKEIFNK